MPAHATTRPVCRNCNGFPVVAITTGDRHADGSRVLLRVVCHACRGTGRTQSAPLVSVGK